MYLSFEIGVMFSLFFSYHIIILEYMKNLEIVTVIKDSFSYGRSVIILLTVVLISQGYIYQTELWRTDHSM